MAELGIKDFDFTNAADWTLTESGVIESDMLTLPDEVIALWPWSDVHWSPAMPEEPADSDVYEPVIDQLYYAMDGGGPTTQRESSNAAVGLKGSMGRSDRTPTRAGRHGSAPVGSPRPSQPAD